MTVRVGSRGRFWGTLAISASLGACQALSGVGDLEFIDPGRDAGARGGASAGVGGGDSPNDDSGLGGMGNGAGGAGGGACVVKLCPVAVCPL